jgi:hypothetical protein
LLSGPRDRWRLAHDSLKTGQAKTLQEPEAVNARLKRFYAELAIHIIRIQVLQGAAR